MKKSAKLKAVPAEQAVQPTILSEAQTMELGAKVTRFTAQIQNWMKKQGIDKDRVNVNVHMQVKDL